MQTYITLNDGTKIPQFGLGVYQVPDGEATYNAVLDALKMGVRHIDTAHAYQNERSVGKAVKDSSVSREEVWITTKLWPHEYGEGKTAAAIDKMLDRLGTDYIDLLLLHQQFGDYLGAWKDMEKAVKADKVKSIGISNFESERLEEICEAADIKPSVLQVECHPYYQQNALKKRIEKYGTVIESWYPILRWHIQEGTIVFPRTTNPQHMKENFDIFDFELTADEMAEIRALDCGKRFFNMTLEQQEANLGAWHPAD